MIENNPLVYSSDGKLKLKLKRNEKFSSVIWTPSMKRVIPPGKPFKYVVYWIFHFLGVFKNENYFSAQLYENERQIASLLVVPAYYKWPFMKRQDVQITYVMTAKEYRGRGLAGQMIQDVFAQLKDKNLRFWYVTTEINLPSQRVVEKLGFKFEGIAMRKGQLIKKLVL